MDNNSANQNKTKIIFKIDLRIIVVLLLLIIITLLAIWRPWQNLAADSDRTISINGEATVSAKPDQYVFNPSYEFNNSDRQAAIDAASKKSTEIVAKLKSLGVADSMIKTSTGGYSMPVYPMENKNASSTYSLWITVKVKDESLSQKVQDYLAQTAPSGSVSPQADFSDAKRKELENNARDLAAKDAKSKADRMAANLGFKLGKIKSVTDGFGFGIIEPMKSTSAVDGGATISSGSGSVSVSANSIQPGENDISYTVTVIYYLK